MVPVCLVLVRWHVLTAVAGGALTYAGTLTALGGLDLGQIGQIFGRNGPSS
jgi:hypothetical protein